MTDLSFGKADILIFICLQLVLDVIYLGEKVEVETVGFTYILS